VEQQAKDFARKAHQGQLRKISGIPYIIHPIRVAELLKKAGCSQEVVSAGYLHDVVEDTNVEMKDIYRLFGPRVAELVAAHTEDKSKSWHERKQHTIDIIKYAEKEVKYLIIADKLDNLLSIEKELNIQGDALWKYFNADFEKQKWFHQSIVQNMYEGLAKKDVPAFFREFENTVKSVFH